MSTNTIEVTLDGKYVFDVPDGISMDTTLDKLQLQPDFSSKQFEFCLSDGTPISVEAEGRKTIRGILDNKGRVSLKSPGWKRDLTMECVESNPGPSMKEVLDLIAQKVGADATVQAHLAKLADEIKKANGGNPFLTDDHVVRFFATQFDTVKTIVGGPEAADGLKKLLDEIVKGGKEKENKRSKKSLVCETCQEACSSITDLVQHFLVSTHAGNAVVARGETEWRNVTLKRRGGFNTDADIVMFMRPAAVELLSMLESGKNIIVDGAPGTGKSLLTWLWACEHSKTKPVCWLHMANGKAKVGCILRGGEIYPQFFYDDVEFLDAIDIGVVVADGAATGMKLPIKLLEWQDRSPTDRRIIVVASIQFEYNRDALVLKGFLFYTMPLWALEEYTKAVKNATFRAQVGDVLGECNEADLDAQYHYAGLSARWMFSTKREAVKSDIEYHVTRVKDATALANNASLGVRSMDAVNHLLALSAKGTIVISAYVAVVLANRFHEQFLKMAYAQEVTRNNPTLHGWIFEADVVFQLKHAKNGATLFTDTEGGSPDNWKVGKGFEFTKVGDVANFKNLVSGDYIQPLLWNQGCYDFILLPPNEQSVRFVQVTCASTHEIKTKFMVEMLDALETVYKFTRVELVIIVPLGNTFKLPTYIASLGRHQKSFSSLLGGKRVYVYYMKKTE